MVGNPSGLAYHRPPATPAMTSAPFRDCRHHRLGRIPFGRKLPQERRPSRGPNVIGQVYQREYLYFNYKLLHSSNNKWRPEPTLKNGAHPKSHISRKEVKI